MGSHLKSIIFIRQHQEKIHEQKCVKISKKHKLIKTLPAKAPRVPSAFIDILQELIQCGYKVSFTYSQTEKSFRDLLELAMPEPEFKLLLAKILVVPDIEQACIRHDIVMSETAFFQKSLDPHVSTHTYRTNPDKPIAVTLSQYSF